MGRVSVKAKQRSSAGSTEQDIIIFENCAGEPAGRERAGIQIDSIGMDFRLAYRRMTMDHDLSEVALVKQEFLPDQQEVVGALFGQGYGGSDARVNEKVIAAIKTRRNFIRKLRW